MDEKNHTLEQTVKKADMEAATRFDLEKLSAAGEHFLPMTWREDGDDRILCYDSDGLLPFTEVREEETVTVLNLLILAAKLAEDAKRFYFPMDPENLFFHPCGQLLVQFRDIRTEQQDAFLEEYRALAGWALSGKYACRDYLEGGADLYAKHELTEGLPECDSVEAIEQYLLEYRAAYLEKQKSGSVSVPRRRYRLLRIAVPVLAVWAAVVSVYGGRQYFRTIPYLQAVNQADNAYIENNYDGLIDALRGLSVQSLDRHQKYTLALAYLQAENLSEEQRQNAGKNVTLKSDERYLEYWIYIGRLEAGQAEETAMSLMDDELLLYAYLLDKELTQADDGLDGVEKQQRLKELQSDIDELTKSYGLDTEEAAPQ